MQKTFTLQMFEKCASLMLASSVTRLGDFLHFGQLLKPLATISLPKSLTFLGNFCMCQNLVKSFLGTFYRHLAKNLVTLVPKDAE